jgi:hypothetical protein
MINMKEEYELLIIKKDNHLKQISLENIKLT